MKWKALKFKLILKYPWLGHFISGSDGFIDEPLKEEDYRMGASPLFKKVLQEDGQWDEYLPEVEPQAGRVETMGCTGFGLLNVLETLAKKKGYGEWNRSDRYTNKMSGVSSRGNTMTRVLESVRSGYGTVDQKDWVNDVEHFDWARYYAQIPADIIDRGKNWLKDWSMGYEALWNTKSAMKEALKFSPLYVAGYAWYPRDGKYVSVGNPNHVFMIYGYKEGEYWKAFDSYEPYLKKLDWNSFTVHYPKIITLNAKDAEFNLDEIHKLIKRGYRYIMRVHDVGQIYELLESGLKYISAIEWNNVNVKRAAENGELQPRSELDFYKLLK